MPRRPPGCGEHKMSATDSRSSGGMDDIDIVFDDAGDLRPAREASVPRALLSQRRQLQVLMVTEAAHMPSPTFIEDLQHAHSGMTQEWRKSLVDWVIEFMVALRYTTETYSLAINYMDRFLSKVTVDQNCMQTLAIACCLTASKVQGDRPIRMAEIRTMFGSSVDVQHVKSVEVQVCSHLTFMLSPNVSQTFVYFLSSLVPDEERTTIRRCGLLAADLAMTNYQALQYRPSVLGVAAVLAAYKVSAKDPATFAAAVCACGLSVEPAAVRKCVTFLASMMQRYYPELCRDAGAASPTTITDMSLTGRATPGAPSPAVMAPSPAPVEEPFDDVDMTA